MQRIAVALIDALGFKGIWNRVESSRVVNTLRCFRDVAAEMTADVNHWPTSVSFHAQAISDSLIFATTTCSSTAKDWWAFRGFPNARGC